MVSYVANTYGRSGRDRGRVTRLTGHPAVPKADPLDPEAAAQHGHWLRGAVSAQLFRQRHRHHARPQLDQRARHRRGRISGAGAAAALKIPLLAYIGALRSEDRSAPVSFRMRIDRAMGSAKAAAAQDYRPPAGTYCGNACSRSSFPR